MSKRNPGLIKSDEIPEVFKGKKFLELTYDTAFRAFFSDKTALKDFLNNLLRLGPGRRIKKLSYKVQYPLEFRIPQLCKAVFDIQAITEDQRYLDIEMQRRGHSFFVDRILLYGSYLVIKGKKLMNESEMFLAFDEAERDRRRYEIPETICIWLCDFHPIAVILGLDPRILKFGTARSPIKLGMTRLAKVGDDAGRRPKGCHYRKDEVSFGRPAELCQGTRGR